MNRVIYLREEIEVPVENADNVREAIYDYKKTQAALHRK